MVYPPVIKRGNSKPHINGGFNWNIICIDGRIPSVMFDYLSATLKDWGVQLQKLEVHWQE